MNNLRKRLLSLAVASFMVGAAGCSKNKKNIKYEINSQTNQSELVGTASINEIKNYYIVVITEIDGRKQFYLTYENIVYDKLLGFEPKHNLVGNDFTIIDSNGYSPCGCVENIYRFIEFVPQYSTIKDEYNGYEIQDVFDAFIENYDNIKISNDIKKYKRVKK